MSRWLVTQDNAQFGVDTLEDLRRLAASGELEAGDMVQPPGAADWLYAGEVPELSTFFGASGTLDDEDDEGDWRPRRGLGMLGTAAVVIVLLGVLGVGVLSMAFFYARMPVGDEALIGDRGLSYSEMLVTGSGVPLRAEPKEGAREVTKLAKDTRLQLLAKRGDFYRARTSGGEEGWVPVNEVLPMYLLGGGTVMAEHDPLYNPDRYIDVRNASWLQIDQNNSQLTVFRFLVQNQSRYAMTDLVLLAVIKDAKGKELERVEIPVQGVLPASDSTMVGTLAPEDKRDPEARPQSITHFTFQAMAEADPDLQLLYSDGVEVRMTSEDFTEATIDVLEVRAIPATPARG